MKFTIESAREFLQKADLFFGSPDDEDEEWREMAQTLNLNDTWGWACADGEDVSDEDLPRVAELFWRYGRCGVLYWVSERRNQCRSEFHDVNREIDFVRHEERIRSEFPNSSKRAYAKVSYTIGEQKDV